jgi:hypothetical protein
MVPQKTSGCVAALILRPALLRKGFCVWRCSRAALLTKVEHAVKVEAVGEFELKGIRRPLAAYNVLAAVL